MDWLASSVGVWVLGLISLAIPIAIHLYSRSKHQKMTFSTLAFFPDKPPQNHKQIKLTQKRLLLTRLLLLVSIILLLLGLFNSENQPDAKRILIVTDDWLAFASDEQRSALLNELKNDSAHSISLSSGNELSVEQIKEKTLQVTTYSNTWYRVSDWLLNNPYQANEIVVYSTNGMSQFIGEKFILPSKVEWQIIERTESNDSSLYLSLLLIEPNSNTQAAIAEAKKTILRAVNVLNQLPNINIEVYQHTIETVKQSNLKQVSATIMLSSALSVNKNELSTLPTTEKLLFVNELEKIDSPLLPIELIKVLFSRHAEKAFWQRARISQEAITSTASGNNLVINQQIENTGFATEEKPLPINNWLALICVLLFILERIFSEYTNRITSEEMRHKHA